MKQIPGGVYLITNTRDDRRYAGSTANLTRRIRDHKSDLRNGRHKNKRLQQAWDEYGEDAFNFSIMERKSVPDGRKEAAQVLANCEQWWFDELQIDITHDFNMAPVAGSNLGFKHSEESRTLMSQSKKGRTFTDEQRARMSIGHMGNPSNTGKKASPETRAKQSVAHKGNKGRTGQPLSDDHKAKVSNALTGVPKSEEHKAKISVSNKEYARKVAAGEIAPKPRAPLSEQAHINLSNAAKLRWERRRLNENPDTEQPDQSQAG